MRIILFTGKGGVGKTTIACATALSVARAGLKSLVMSTDPAHSLADAFGTDLGPYPTEVAPNLWAEQIDPQIRLEENWRAIQRHAVAVLNWAGIAEIEAEELSMIPGLDEIFALADVKRHRDEDPYDVLIVDCAPTGETLRLLSLPDVIQWYMERIFPVERRLVGAIRPVAKRVTSLPLPGEDVYRAIRRFYDRLEGVKALLTDPEATSIRLVVNPEAMVISEARRTYTYLSLFGYRVDAVVVNRLLPTAVTDPYFARWKEIQGDHMRTIDESFAPLPILTAPLKDRELAGTEALIELADDVYGDADPAGVLAAVEPMTITKSGDAYLMCLALPFVRKEDLELGRKADELLVKVGAYRRTIMLPSMLAKAEVGAARVTGDRVEIRFVPRPPASRVRERSRRGEERGVHDR